MARNRQVFEQNIKKSTKESAKKAYAATFKVKMGENESIDSMAEKVSNEFAKVFSKDFAPKLSKHIDDQMDSQTFDTTKLIAPSGGGPCTGEIKSISN